MYTNIDTKHTILVIGLWIGMLSTRPDFPKDFPVKAVKDAMKIIMQNNLFEFGKAKFLQLLGITMAPQQHAFRLQSTLHSGKFNNCYPPLESSFSKESSPTSLMICLEPGFATTSTTLKPQPAPTVRSSNPK